MATNESEMFASTAGNFSTRKKVNNLLQLFRAEIEIEDTESGDGER